jgi:hypothetical protein
MGVNQMTVKIKNIGKTQRRIETNKVLNALGAERINLKVNTKGTVGSIFFLGRLIQNKLHSTGGRPSLIGAQKNRTKIPLFKEDWSKLKKISEYCKKNNAGRHVSPAQIASILLHKTLETEINKFKFQVSDKTFETVGTKQNFLKKELFQKNDERMLLVEKSLEKIMAEKKRQDNSNRVLPKHRHRWASSHSTVMS